MGSPLTTSSFPGFESVFKLSDPVANPPFRGKLLFEKPFRLLRAELSPPEPVRVEHAMGGKPQDLIWTTWAAVFLISDRVRELLEGAHVTGWKTYPVEVTDRQGAIIPGYHGFAATGRCGPIDPSRSELYLKPPPVPQGKACWHRKGLFFEPSSWDGSDVFCPSDGSGFIFLLDRVKRLLEKAKVRNVKFKKLVDYEVLVPRAELDPPVSALN